MKKILILELLKENAESEEFDNNLKFIPEEYENADEYYARWKSEKI